MMVLDVMLIPHKYPNLTHSTHNQPTDSPYHPREADNGVSRPSGGGGGGEQYLRMQTEKDRGEGAKGDEEEMQTQKDGGEGAKGDEEEEETDYAHLGHLLLLAGLFFATADAAVPYY